MKKEWISIVLAFAMLCTLVWTGDAVLPDAAAVADAETVWTADITLSGDGAQWTGDGVTAEDGVLTVTGTGTYRLTGEWQEGRIVVEAGKKGYVTLVLDGLTVASSTGSALEIASCSRVTVVTAEGSENRLESAASGEEGASALMSKADLWLEGEGSLTLTSAGKHGVQTADSLSISSGKYVIEAAKAGLRANDFIRITGGEIRITGGADGIHADGDESKPDTGRIEISGGSLTIASGDDGVHAETVLTVSGGSITVTESREGLEGRQIEILGGDLDITASDDGINAGGGNPDSGESGFPAGGFDGTFPQDGERPEPPEGFAEDGTLPELPQGPDGTEADGELRPENMEPPEGVGPGGAAGGHRMDEIEKSDALLRIAGGRIHVRADGDGLDSNGDLVIECGEILVDGPENGMNGALDCGSESGGTLTVTGGTVLAIGASGMDECFDESSEQVSFRYAGLSFSAGDVISVALADGTVLLEHTAETDGDSVVFSSPELAVGETVLLSAGEETAELQLTGQTTVAGESRGFTGASRNPHSRGRE